MKITKDALILAQALGGGGGITPTGNQDITTLNEYDVTDKATARVSAAERAKITADHITSGTTILGVAGSAVVPSGNQDIETLNEYDVTAKATARISATERAKIIPENIKQGETILGVEGSYSGGGGGIPPKDVNFIDYDGTILYSYSAADFANLSAMPANPTREGLTAQGWNWELADAKTYVSTYGSLNIGQMYITDDGKTRLYISIPTAERTSPALKWTQSGGNGVTIDWGDNSAVDTVTGNYGKSQSHTYSAAGDYVISITPTEGCNISLGQGSQANPVLSGTYAGSTYANMLKKIEIGRNAAFSHYACSYCEYLETVTLPNTLAINSSYVFQYCESLKSITIPTSSTATTVFTNCIALERVSLPKSVATVSSYTFQSCMGITKINLPPDITTINSYIFGACYGLTRLKIPAGVTSIKGYAFSSCTGMAIYDFTACSSVPTLEGTSAFTSIQNDCQILVPASLYETWKAASNWSTYASKIVAV